MDAATAQQYGVLHPDAGYGPSLHDEFLQDLQETVCSAFFAFCTASVCQSTLTAPLQSFLRVLCALRDLVKLPY